MLCRSFRAAGVPSSMDLRRVTDWTILPGASMETRHQGFHLSTGHVGTVTDDRKDPVATDRSARPETVELTECYGAWAAEA